MSDIKQNDSLAENQELTDAELARVTGGAPTTTTQTTSGGGTGKVVVQDFHFTKKVD